MRKPERQIIPYRAKVVEPISLLPYEERVRRIEACGNNLFRLGSHEVYIDLITNSGTGALSNHQMGRMMIGDEAYAGSRSFFEMERQIRESMGYRYAIPVHQGRAGERVFDFVLIKKHMIVPGNSHFDTTKAHIEFAGGRAIDRGISSRMIQHANALLADTYPADGPGAAVLIARGDEVLYRSARGMANIDLRVPLSPDQVFRIGSVTKQFAAAGLLRTGRPG